MILELINELDSFFTGATTAAFNTYIQMLREEVCSHEKALLEAQRIAAIGSFECDLITNHTQKSPEVDRIFEMENEGFEAFLEYVYPADREPGRNAVDKSFKEGSHECEYRFQNNGATKYIWAKGAIIYDDGKPVKFIGTVQDITERKKAEQELVEKTLALERSNESLQQFAFVASHDLQEPMRHISTFTDIVLTTEKNLSDSSRINLHKVVNHAIRLRQMIDDIFAYSTLKQWQGREDVDLKDILKAALENLEQSIHEKKACIEYDELPVIHAMPSQIQQLLQNLISNALKFGRPGILPKITITSRWCNKEDINSDKIHVADKYLELTVEDNGIGFEQQFATKIFGLFSRLNNKKDYVGSGIGLAIAKKIVDNHGGSISASSIEGRGSKFTILLPQ